MIFFFFKFQQVNVILRAQVYVDILRVEMTHLIGQGQVVGQQVEELARPVIIPMEQQEVIYNFISFYI